MTETGAEPLAEFYDFLYRDVNRLISYYSQIFQGELTSIEEQDNTKDGKKTTIGGSVQVASGSRELTEEDSQSAKRLFTPRDLNTTDILSYLRENHFINNDFINAGNGELVLVPGKLFFVDTYMLSASLRAFELQHQTPDSDIEQTINDGIEVIKPMVTSGFFPPIFFLKTDEGYLVSGTIKDAGMEEPVSTYYIRHGASGLDDVYAIGIKEIPSPIDMHHLTPLLIGTTQFSEVLRHFLCSQESIRLTPLVLFRTIKPRKRGIPVAGQKRSR